ncbi:LysR family transcriptional regulator [Alphaproteobacteria bacterium]|nr:LysR family transcriptional regulator [Alphaproteobacteria bacterium]
MQSIDPRHLVQFHEIIRTGSFTRAAQTLGLTQPALTRNMKVMESRLGFDVLVRSRQRIVPTTIGVRILEEAAGVVMAERRIKALTKSIAIEAEAPLRIGCTPSASLHLLPAPFRNFASRFAMTRLDVRCNGGPELLAMLANDEIEVALGPLDIASQSSFGRQKFFDCQLVIVAARNHALARKASVSIGDLAHQHWVLFQRGTIVNALSQSLLETMQLGRNVASTALPAGMILPFLQNGTHLGIVPRYCLWDSVIARDFVQVQTANAAPQFAYGAIWKAAPALGQSATQFIQMMQAELAPT